MNETPQSARARFTLAALLASLVALSSCTGCSGGGGVATIEAAEERPANPIPTSAITVQGQPGTFGGTLTVAVPDDLTTFNPYAISQPSNSEILRQLYAPLIGFNPTTGKILPQEGLAQSFEADGKVVTIRMRQGLLFSDGTPIRADDVVYSLKVATDPDLKSPLADMLTVSGRLPEIGKVDDATVKLEFTEPYPAIGYVLSQLPVICAGPEPDKLIEKGRFEEALNIDTSPATIACSGPFHVGAYTKGKEIKLDYNPNYWKVDAQSLRLPYLDHIVYRFAVAKEELIQRLKNGSISLAVDVPPKVFGEMGQGDDQYATKDLGVGYGTWQLFGNINPATAADKVKVAWMLDPHFREFLARIVDRDAIIKEVFDGKATAAYGPVTSANSIWYNGSIKKYPYDLTGAMSALGNNYHIAERNGKPQMLDVVDRVVKFNLYYPKDTQAEDIQKILVDRFAKAGVPINAIAVEPSKLLTQYIQKGAFELVLWRMDGFGPDPISYMPAMMQNGSQHWYLNTAAGAQSPLEFEVLVGRLMRSQQDKKLDADRQKDFTEVQKLWAEGNPVSYVVADNVLLAFDKRLGNFQPVAFRPYASWNAEQLFFKR